MVSIRGLLVYILRLHKLPKGRIVFGKHTRATPYVFSFLDDTVTIGNFVSIGPDVMIIPGRGHIPHRGYENRRISTFPLVILAKKKDAEDLARANYNLPAIPTPVKIGSDVWIGARAIILSGVTIGDGAIIGAGAVVTRDIPPYAIAAGTSAKILKFRYDEDQIRKLLAIAWWNWSDEKISQNINYFYDDVEKFTARFFPSVSAS